MGARGGEIGVGVGGLGRWAGQLIGGGEVGCW